MDEAEVRFADGNLSDVVRVGDTVRRVPGSWSPAVHALLRHLEAVGFDGVPASGEVICQDDVGPWDVVARGGQPCALIKWDLAAPAPRTWDVAHAPWRFGPLLGHVPEAPHFVAPLE